MNELLIELAKLNDDEFFTQMADHLSSEDYDLLHKIHDRKVEIIAELKDKYGLDYYTQKDTFNELIKKAAEEYIKHQQ